MSALVLSEGSRKVCLHPGVSERPPPHLAWLHVHHAASADCGWRCHHQVLNLKDHVLHSHQSYLGHDIAGGLLPILMRAALLKQDGDFYFVHTQKCAKIEAPVL